MRSRSSIFSSDTLAASLRPTRAVVAALAVCVAFRILLGWFGPGLTDLFGYWLVDTDMGWARVQLDREPVAGKPRCLALGSSRIGLGLHEQTLADELGWQVIKTPVNAGTPWTFLTMFEAEPRLLDGVDAMIVDVEYFQFNDASPVREGYRYQRLGDPFDPLWREVAAVRGYDAGWIEFLWPVSRERRDLMEVVKGVALHLTDGRPYRPMDERWRRWDANAARLQDAGMAPEAAARRIMENYEFSPFMVDTWARLAGMCHARDIELFVIHPPVMREFVAQLTSREEWVRHREKVRESVAELENLPQTSVIFVEDLAEVGLEDEAAMLMDYGHLTGAGARAYTAWLAEQIRARLAAKPGAGGAAAASER